MIHNTQSKYLRNSFIWIILAIVLIIIFGSYIQVELATKVHKNELNGNEYCPKKLSELSYYKIVKYEKYKKDAVLYCIYKDKSSNSEVRLNYTDKWQIVSANRMFQKSGLHWPLYF